MKLINRSDMFPTKATSKRMKFTKKNKPPDLLALCPFFFLLLMNICLFLLVWFLDLSVFFQCFLQVLGLSSK